MLWCPDTTWIRNGYSRNIDFTHKEWNIKYDKTWYVAHFEVFVHHRFYEWGGWVLQLLVRISPNKTATPFSKNFYKLPVLFRNLLIQKKAGQLNSVLIIQMNLKHFLRVYDVYNQFHVKLRRANHLKGGIW